MPLIIRDRRQPEPQSLTGYVIKDRVVTALIAGGVTCMIGIITASVTYLARTLPERMQDHDNRIMRNEIQIQGLEQSQGRTINILEKHDQRLRELEKGSRND